MQEKAAFVVMFYNIITYYIIRIQRILLLYVNISEKLLWILKYEFLHEFWHVLKKACEISCCCPWISFVPVHK